MPHTLLTEPQLFDDAFERECLNVQRLLRSFPVARLDDRLPGCHDSAREVAVRFVGHHHTLAQLVLGPSPGRLHVGPASLQRVHAELDESRRHLQRALARLAPAQWGELIRVSLAVGPWERARRGELLWIALKDMVREASHFAIHLRAALAHEAAERDRGARMLRRAGLGATGL